MRPRRSWYTIFPPKDGGEHDYQLFCLFWTNRYSVYSVNSAIGSRIDGILFRSFWNQNRSQKNTITTNSVYSHSGTVLNKCTLSDASILIYSTWTDWLSWGGSKFCKKTLQKFLCFVLIQNLVQYLIKLRKERFNFFVCAGFYFHIYRTAC